MAKAKGGERLVPEIEVPAYKEWMERTTPAQREYLDYIRRRFKEMSSRQQEIMLELAPIIKREYKARGCPKH